MLRHPFRGAMGPRDLVVRVMLVWCLGIITVETRRLLLIFSMAKEFLLVVKLEALWGNFDGDVDDVLTAPLAEAENKLLSYRRRASSFQIRPGVCQWKCPDCPFVVESPSSQTICKSQYNHIQNHHDGQGQASRLSRPSQIVVEHPGEDVFGFFWQCPCCIAGSARPMRAQISWRIYFDEIEKHQKAADAKVSTDRFRSLSRAQFETLVLQQNRRVYQLNAGASQLKLKLPAERLADLVRFSWPEVCSRKTSLHAWFRQLGNANYVVDVFAATCNHVCKEQVARRY